MPEWLSGPPAKRLSLTGHVGSNPTASANLIFLAQRGLIVMDIEADGKTMLVVRGLPGSGKTFFAKILESAFEEAGREVLTLCTDDYPGFTDEDGNYSFHISKLNDAITWVKNCAERVTWGSEVDLLIVTGTFTLLRHTEYWKDLALATGYRYVQITMNNAQKFTSVHNVPEEHVNRMRENFEHLA